MEALMDMGFEGAVFNGPVVVGGRPNINWATFNGPWLVEEALGTLVKSGTPTEGNCSLASPYDNCGKHE